MESQLQCVVGEPSSIYSAGLATVLDGAGIAIAGHAGEPEDFVAMVRRHSPDVAVSGFDPPALSLAVAHMLPGVAVVVLATTIPDDVILDAMRAGVRALAPKDAAPAEVVRAVRTAARGGLAFPTGWERMLAERLEGRYGSGRRLTSRECEIVQLVLDGCSNKQVAANLGIAEQTAKNHLHHVMTKVGVASRTQLSAWAIRAGYEPRGVD